MLNKKTLKLMHFNCNSIINKLVEFNELIRYKNIDVGLISETFSKSYHIVEIDNYDIIRRDDPDDIRGGGVAIIIRKNFHYKEMKVPELKSISNVCAIKLELESEEDIVFVSVYVKNMVKKIEKRDMAFLMRLGSRVLIGGDFNAKSKMWKCQTENKRGKSLEEYLIDQNGTVNIHASETPTYFPYNYNKKPSYIDLSIVKNISITKHPLSLPMTDSDHNPVFVEINLNSRLLINKDYRFDYKRANWNVFEAKLNQNLKRVTDVSLTIEDEITHLTKAIKLAERTSIPIKTSQVQKIPRCIQKLITEKNKIRRLTQQSDIDINTRNMLKIQMKDLRREILVKLKAWKNSEMNKKLVEIKPYDTRLYQNINKITKKTQPIPALQDQDNMKVYATHEKAELLANYFEKVHETNLEMGEPTHEEFVNQTVENFLSQNIVSNVITTDSSEIKSIIKNLKNNKAPGKCGIMNNTIKKLTNVALMYLVNIINLMLLTGIFPQIWKIANVLAIPKPNKDSKIPNNYRPISLLSNLSKIAEKVIAVRLLKELIDKNILQSEQFGFREKTSTAHALLFIRNDIMNGFKNGKSTSMVLLDIEKAFDTVWHKGLVFNLIKIGISPYLIKIINSYLRNRKFECKINNTCSRAKSIAAGVPQGSILGPWLFLVYIHDLPKQPRTKLSIFADDTSIRSTNKSIKQSSIDVSDHLKILKPYYDKWKIKVNALKSEYILFTRKRKRGNDNPVRMMLSDTPIEHKTAVKYLGITFTTKCKFNVHVNKELNKASDASSKLWCLFGHKSKLNVTNKLLIYKTYIIDLR